MINVILFCDVEIERREMDIVDIDDYVALIKKFGFCDAEGQDYDFAKAQVDTDGFYIYLSVV